MTFAYNGPIRILVIDDQKSMRSILRQLLTKAGFSDIDDAACGRQALERLRDTNAPFPDVIITDLHMEGMDGLEFCNCVRRDKELRNSRVPVLVLTGNKDTLLHEVSKQLGAVSVLTKPVAGEKLKDHIIKAVGYNFA